MKRQNKTTFVNFITWLLIVLLLLGCIAAVLHFAGIGKDDITDIFNPTFRIEHDGNVYKTDTENVLAAPKSGQARFDVKNCESCTIKVLPNVTAETDFTFTVREREQNYSEVKDLTAAFIQQSNVYGDYFIIDFDNDYSFESVLSRLYSPDSVTVPENNLSPSYKLVVTSQSSETIEIILRFEKFVPIEDIQLDKQYILFGGELVNPPAQDEGNDEEVENPPAEEEESVQYEIGYDTLGTGNLSMIGFECVPRATAGETVTFTVSLVGSSDGYSISRIAVSSAETGEEEIELGSGEGTFSFTMPTHDVTVMFYLLNW